jgi:hypothetical protein
MRESLPSPLWGRGWTATGVFISRGRTGEGVEPVKVPYPYRKTRSLARRAGQINKTTMCCGSSTVQFGRPPGLIVHKAPSLIWSLPEALG